MIFFPPPEVIMRIVCDIAGADPPLQSYLGNEQEKTKRYGVAVYFGLASLNGINHTLS